MQLEGAAERAEVTASPAPARTPRASPWRASGSTALTPARVSPYPQRTRTLMRTPMAAPTTTAAPTAVAAPTALAVVASCAPASTTLTPARVSPYPQRPRTPVRTSTAMAAPTATAVTAASGRRKRASVSRISGSLQDAATTTRTQGSDTLELRVQPVVKATVSQKDTSALRLDKFLATGRTFDDILHKLWEHFRPWIEGKAIKTEDGCAYEKEVFITDWKHFFQFKSGKYRVESDRTDASWNSWVTSYKDETLLLVIHKYGDALGKKDDNDEFLAACVRPRQRDRAGATAQIEINEVVEQLKAHWEETFDTSNATWGMWANHITRNLNRTTWEALVAEDPPDHIARLLRPAHTATEEQLERIVNSGHMARDTVESALEDYERLRAGWVVMSKGLAAMERELVMMKDRLGTRHRCVEASISAAGPVPMSDVMDPLEVIENVDDVEHAE